MGNLQGIQTLLDSAGIEVGDTIRLKGKKGTFIGVLMPHHEFSSEDIITIKLISGYNIGLRVEKDTRLELVEKGKKRVQSGPKMENFGSKPSVSILGTGGTIASYVDYRTGAVFPAKSAEELVHSVPELKDLCRINAKVMFSIFSEDMTVTQWQHLAKETASELNNGARGVIIPHGTDTLGYTSAALAFMLSDLSGPVILVGAQRSSDRPSSDATLNLIAAVKFALQSDVGEVVVLMHENPSDMEIAVHRGTRVRKMHTSRRDAFCSVNVPPLGNVKDQNISLQGPYKKRSENNVTVRSNMEEKVALVYTYPGMSEDNFVSLAEKNKGIVMAGTGLGHVPSILLKSIKKAVSEGVIVAMASQCLSGRVNLNVYSAGRDLLKSGVIPCDDMLPETAFVKLMWVMGQTKDKKEIEAMMTMDIAGEIQGARNL